MTTSYEFSELDKPQHCDLRKLLGGFDTITCRDALGDTSYRDALGGDFRNRENRKGTARADFEAGVITSLACFETVSKTYYEREPDKVRDRVGIYEYRCGLVRSLCDEEMITDEVRLRYPPATGPLHFQSGGSDWSLKPLKTKNPDCNQGFDK